MSFGSSQSTSQKKSAENLEEATDVQKAAAQQFLADPIFGQVRQATEQIFDTPLTFGPEQREGLFQRQAAMANRAANDFLTNARVQATGPGGPGFRSGSQRQAEILAASGLGEALANSRAQIELQGAQQDRTDLQNLMATGADFLNLQQLPQDKVVQALLGQGQVLGQQGPEQQGFGAALGGILGQAAGGITGNANLFKPTS